MCIISLFTNMFSYLLSESSEVCYLKLISTYEISTSNIYWYVFVSNISLDLDEQEYQWNEIKFEAAVSI